MVTSTSLRGIVRVTHETEEEYQRILERLRQESPGGRRQLGFQVSATGDGAGG